MILKKEIMQGIYTNLKELKEASRPDMPSKHKVQHHILTQDPPVFQQPRRLHPEKEPTAKQEVDAMLEANGDM